MLQPSVTPGEAVECRGSLPRNSCTLLVVYVSVCLLFLLLLLLSRFVPFSSRQIYLVDPAISHMLVSKIKPCMSQGEFLCLNKPSFPARNSACAELGKPNMGKYAS